MTPRIPLLVVSAVLLTGACAAAASAAPASTDPPPVKFEIDREHSTPTELIVKVTLPGTKWTRFTDVTAPTGEQFLKMTIPGLVTSFDPTKTIAEGLGRPGLPAVSIPFAIPEAADGGTSGLATVSSEISSMTWKTIKLKRKLFPALDQPLDSIASSTVAFGLGRGRSSCASAAGGTRVICWGNDYTAPDGSPSNLLRDWLASPVNASSDDQSLKLRAGAAAVSGGRWSDIAVGQSSPGGPTDSACLVGLPPGTVDAASSLAKVRCFGPYKLAEDSVGSDPGSVPATDVKLIESSAPVSFETGGGGQAEVGSEYCFLRNAGSRVDGAGNGEIACFGRGMGRDWTIPDEVNTGFRDLSVGRNHACAINEDRKPFCFGGDWDAEGASVPSDAPELISVEAGSAVDCGIRRDNRELYCWGVGDRGADALAAAPIPADDPATAGSEALGPIRSISIAGTSACVLSYAPGATTDGKLRCFPFDEGADPDTPDQVFNAPDYVSHYLGTANSITLGGSQGSNFACGLSKIQKTVCWGNDLNKEIEVPDELNAPVAFTDPVFGDYLESPPFPGFPVEKLRPFKKVEEVYVSPDPVPSGDLPSTQGGAVSGSSTLSGAAPLHTEGEPPARLRGLGVGQLYLYGAQYTAATNELSLVQSATIKIKFSNVKLGSDGKPDYGLSSIDSPWNESAIRMYGSTLVNADIALGNLTPNPGLKAPRNKRVAPGSPLCGEEMLIVTDPSLEVQARELAAAKNRQGLLTKLVRVGDPEVGSNPESIRNFVQGQFSKTDPSSGSDCVAPSFLLLFGDTPPLKTSEPSGFKGVPTFTSDVHTTDIASDFDYAESALGSYIPNLAVGRLPVANESDARTVVGKILGYEEAPPSSAADFYKNFTVTAFYQADDAATGKDKWKDQRGFVYSAENTISLIAKDPAGKGKTPSRLYTAKAVNIAEASGEKKGLEGAPDAGSSKPIRDSFKFTRFSNGVLMPPALQGTIRAKPWSLGTPGNLVADVNAGRFLVVSRDHGSANAILNPEWGTATIAGSATSAVDGMTNGKALPVAWLVACLTGRFDEPGNSSLAEKLVLSKSGMVGVLASSRESPSDSNNKLVESLADAIWPASSTPVGSKRAAVYRMGEVLNIAKMKVLNRGATPTLDDYREMRLYNWFGDPSMPIWIQKPDPVAVSVDGAPSVSTATATVRFKTDAANGSTAVLLDAGDMPIGKAKVAGMSVSISPQNGIAASGGLKLVLIKDQALPTTITLRS